MNASISWDPFLPLNMIVFLALAGLALVALGAYSRQRGTLLRALTLAILTAALFNPTVNQEIRQPLPDVAVLLIDKSASQKLPGREAQTAAAVKNLRKSFAGIKNLELRLATVTSGLATNNDGTRAFTALKNALSDVPPERYAGTIIVSDGQIHDVPAKQLAKGYKGPLHVLLTGSKNQLDRRLTIIDAPKFAIVGQTRKVTFRLDQWGKAPDKKALINLAVDGRAVRQLAVPVGKKITLDVPVAHGGQNIVELFANTIPGELSRQNNRAIAIIHGIRDRLRVLLVSGQPHPGERTWRNLLKADPSVDLVHFTILRPPEKQDGTPINELSLIAFPTRELFSRKLHEFDLVIFDRYARRGVLPGLYLYNIADYVNNGGAVLVAAGPAYAGPASIYHSALSAILPATPTGAVTQTPFRARLTTQGSRHPVVRGLKGGALVNPAWGKWFRLIDSVGNSGTTLLAGPDEKSLLLVARKGKGRVAQLMSDHSWLWARGYDGGGPQAELLRRIAHWLMREPELEEERLVGKQQGAKLVITRQTMADSVPDVTITSPSGKTTSVKLKKFKPGLWRSTFAVSQAGIYKLQNGDKIAFAGIGSPDPRETGEIHATGAHVKKLVDKTGGNIKWLENGTPRLAMISGNRAYGGSGWLGLKANGAYDVKSIESLSLFTTLLALAALLVLVCALWYREGR